MAISKFGSIPGATVRTWRAKYRKELETLKQKYGTAYDPMIHNVTSLDAENKVSKSLDNNAIF